MNIWIRNSQRSFPVNIPRLLHATQCMTRTAGVGDYSLNIWLTNNAAITQINRESRNQHKATDVLSIAPQTVYPPSLPKPMGDMRILGEIVISLEYVHKHGGELGRHLAQRLERLVAHSICHLLGYNHESDSDFAVMDKKEQELLIAWKKEYTDEITAKKGVGRGKGRRTTKTKTINR